MRIYYASQSFYPHIGGVSTYLLNLAKEMVNKENEVVEVHLRSAGEDLTAEIKGIEIHKVPKEPIDKKIMENYSKFKESVYKECHYNENSFPKPAQEMPGYEDFNKVNEYFGKELRALLEKASADIVHIHDFQLLFTYKHVPRGTPLILTWHIPFIENMSKHLNDFLIRNMNEYDRVVFSSKEYIEAAVKAGLPREKTVLIYPIANTKLFKPMQVDVESVRKKYALPEKGKIILCVQRIDVKSGHEQLIKAMPKVLEQFPEARLVFVGSHSMSNKLSKERETLAEKVKRLVKELKLEQHVVFAGNIDYHLLPEVYNIVDVVALCSKNEGFGLSITEGMSCGKAIVGTRVGGIPAQVKHNENGFLVDVGNIDTTADALIKILKQDGLRKSFGKKSLEIVQKNFSMRSGIEKHLILYNSVIKEKNEFYSLGYFDTSKIKAIITDLDRTITNRPASQVFSQSDFDITLLDEMKSLGIDLFLATGRTISFVKKLCKHFNIWKCVIAENGSVIYFPSTRKTITINTSYMTKAKKIIRQLKLPNTTIGKVIASIKAEHENTLREKLGKTANNLMFIRNVDEVMVLPANVDKGLGIRVAMRYLNIDMDKTIIIGDGENDADMFMNPGFKVALANSDEKLKKLANQVIEKPSTEGMRELISKLKA